MRPSRVLGAVAAMVLSAAAHAHDTIRIATFNIENLGPTKMGKPEIIEQLVEIFDGFDIVAVQELSNKPQHVPYQFLEELNAAHDNEWGMLLSERTGREADDQSSQEQYAYFYKTEHVRPAGLATEFPDSEDKFQREPFVARFESLEDDFSFVLITIHTDPDVALEEIGALDAVNDWADDLYPLEENFITLGDFNAGPNTVSTAELDTLEFRESPYFWITPDDEDTTLAVAPQSHDRIVLRGPCAERDLVTGVDRAFDDDDVSDHWPVFVEFAFDD